MVPPGGFHFNINGLLVCEPYFISNNVLALAACLFYFPTTMILMYCYGTIFHSDKVKVRYKKAVLTSLPFVRASGGSEENANKMAERVRFFFLFWHDGLPGYQTTFLCQSWVCYLSNCSANCCYLENLLLSICLSLTLFEQGCSEYTETSIK